MPAGGCRASRGARKELGARSRESLHRGVHVIGPEHDLHRVTTDIRRKPVVLTCRLEGRDAEVEAVEQQLDVLGLTVGGISEDFDKAEARVELQGARQVARVEGHLGARNIAPSYGGGRSRCVIRDAQSTDYGIWARFMVPALLAGRPVAAAADP